jgi:hypothetical protein
VQTFNSIEARAYLTDARVVAVATDFAQGTRYASATFFGGPVLSSAVLSKLSKSAARRRSRDLYLVGHLRHPWISGVVYSRRQGRRGENSVRICGTHVTSFGDKEAITLILHLDPRDDPFNLASSIADRVVADRREWHRTTEAERAALDANRYPDPGILAPGTLPVLQLAGGYLIANSTAGQGVYSSRSYPTIVTGGA